MNSLKDASSAPITPSLRLWYQAGSSSMYFWTTLIRTTTLSSGFKSQKVFPEVTPNKPIWLSQIYTSRLRAIYCQSWIELTVCLPLFAFQLMFSQQPPFLSTYHEHCKNSVLCLETLGNHSPLDCRHIDFCKWSWQVLQVWVDCVLGLMDSWFEASLMKNWWMMMFITIMMND